MARNRCEKCGFEAQPGDLYATGGFTQRVAPAWWCSLCLAEMQFSDEERPHRFVGELRLFPEPTILTGVQGLWQPGGDSEQAGLRDRRLAEVSLYFLSSGMDVEIVRQPFHGYVIGRYLDMKATFGWVEGANRVASRLTVTIGDDQSTITQLRMLASSPSCFAEQYLLRGGRRACARLYGEPMPRAGTIIARDDNWRLASGRP